MPLKEKLGEDSYDSRKSDSSRSGSRSPPYEDAYERRYSDRPSPGGRNDDSNSHHDERSPGYDRESQQFGDYRRSPVQPVVMNDWRREDRFGNGKKLDDRKGSDDDSRSEGRSPDHQKDKDTMSPPIVRPVRDILGDNVVPLRIIEPPKANGTRIPDASANTRRTASSSSLGSSDGNPAETKRETLASLIDFEADPEPPTKTAVQEPPKAFIVQPAALPTSTSGDTNWASFDLATVTPISQVPTNTNDFDSVLSQLSAPTSVPVQLSGALPLGNLSLSTGGHSTGGPVSHPSMSTYNGGIPAAPSNSGQWPVVQNKEHSLLPANGIQPSVQPFPLQTWNSSFATNTGLSRPQAPQNPTPEVKPSGRTALPEDLFAPTYPSYSVAAQSWNSGPPGGMQYNSTAHIPTYPQTSKMSNPFDLNTDQNPHQAPLFPSMASLHGSLPNMPPSSGLMQTLGPGLPFPAWTQNQLSPYPSAFPPQAPSAASAPSARGYMGQQAPNNMPPSWHQGGFGNEMSGFNSMNSTQHMAGGYSAPPNPAPFSSAGGNPFG